MPVFHAQSPEGHQQRLLGVFERKEAEHVLESGVRTLLEKLVEPADAEGLRLEFREALAFAEQHSGGELALHRGQKHVAAGPQFRFGALEPEERARTLSPDLEALIAQAEQKTVDRPLMGHAGEQARNLAADLEVLAGPRETVAE